MSAPVYQPIVTRDGSAADTAARAPGGAKVVFANLLFGDGGGAPVAPDDTWTKLVDQRCSVPVDKVYVDAVDPNVVWIEGGSGPTTPRGFVIRELAIQMASGALYAVGAVPDTYMPLPSSGADTAARFRIPIVETSGGCVQLVDNPGQWATEEWVVETLAPVLCELLRAVAMLRADVQRIDRRLDAQARRVGRLERAVGWLRAVADQLPRFLPGLNTTPTPDP